MRIIAGEWRGRPLLAPEGRATRPTSDRAREGLFSMLTSRIGAFDGLIAADLFAGTGANGLESLSRGAAHCLFVESDRAALAALELNITRTGASDRAEVRSQAVEHVRPPARPCDLVLMDPPYATALAKMAVTRICNPDWVVPGGIVSIETDGEQIAVPRGFAVVAERRFGKAHITLLRREA